MMSTKPAQTKHVSRSDVQRIFKVYHGNYQQLAQAIAAMNEPEVFLKLWSDTDRRPLFSLLDEVVRLLHNFVAAAEMWVDHSRRLMRQAYDGTALWDEYQREVQARFVNDTLSGFVKDLRNNTLHHQLPALHSRLHSSSGLDDEDGESPGGATLDHSFVLPRDALLTSGKWTSRGRAYLTSSPEAIDIGQVVGQHYIQLHAFYVWLDEKLKEEGLRRWGAR